MKLMRDLFLPALVVIFVAIGAFSGAFDAEADASVENALKRSLITFGIARGLNSVISTAQGTEVSVTPLGMGVTLAPGELLDPLNDLVERFSGFMLVSSVALGTQRVLIEISRWLPFSIFLVALGSIALVVRAFPSDKTYRLSHHLWRGFLFLAVVRFVVPFAVVGSEWMYASFLESRHVEAERGITDASNRVRDLNTQSGLDASEESSDGSWERLKTWAGGTKEKATSVVDFDRYSEALKETTSDAIELIVVFFLSTFLFPIAMALLLWQAVKWVLVRPRAEIRGQFT